MHAAFTNPITPRVVDVFYQSPPAPEIFINVELVKTYVCDPDPENTNNRCGDSLTVTVPAGRFFSGTQEGADAAALSFADGQGTAWIEDCGYKNAELDQDYPCPEGTLGEIVHINIPAGTYCGATQEAADEAAQAAADAQAVDQLAAACGEPIEFSCRSRTGTATLRGYSEFSGASVPPKKYTLKSFSGQSGVLFWSINNCAGPVDCTQHAVYAGSCSWDVITDAEINTGGQVTYSLVGSCGGFPPGYAGVHSICNPIASAGSIGVVSTPTTRTSTAPTTCTNAGAASSHYEAGWNIVETLSVEDTETDAFARFESSPPAWSSWDTGSPTTCLARRSARGAGQFSFTVQQAQYRVAQGGLVAGNTYTYYVNIYRSVYGAGVYTLYSTIPVSGEADISGNIDLEGDVPNDSGYDFYAEYAGTSPP